MNEIDLPDHVSRDQIERLQAEMSLMPQAELTTEHSFSPGMYMRKVFRPAGTLIVYSILISIRSVIFCKFSSCQINI